MGESTAKCFARNLPTNSLSYQNYLLNAACLLIFYLLFIIIMLDIVLDLVLTLSPKIGEGGNLWRGALRANRPQVGQQ